MHLHFNPLFCAVFVTFFFFFFQANFSEMNKKKIYHIKIVAGIDTTQSTPQPEQKKLVVMCR